MLQVHEYDPTVFVQAALLLQLWVLREHSLLSKKEKDKTSTKNPCLLINYERIEVNEFPHSKSSF